MTAELDIVVFLRARLDEREAKARAATRGPWLVEHDEDNAIAVRSYDPALGDGDAALGEQTVAYEPTNYGDADFVHIADNDPKFVLDDVAAKRQILDFIEENPPCLDGGYAYTDPILAMLALPHAGHPDYQEGWKP